MRTIRFILQKEFLQIFRNKAMLPIIFLVPIIQLLILAYAATFEIRHISLAVVDHDLSPSSRLLTSRMVSSGFFDLNSFGFSQDQALKEMAADKADLVLEIPDHFEKDLVSGRGTSLQLIANAINGSKAGIATGYASAIISQFGGDIGIKKMQSGEDKGHRIAITYSNWFNPGLLYTNFMVPGILVVLVTIIGAFLSGMNIVREKEIGTIEQLNVTPIRKYHFIIGKLMPFWVIGLFELAFGLFVARLIFRIPVAGSLGLVFAFAAVYLLVVLGIGLFISTVTDTQQQAMFIAWFFVIIFILLSGLFTPVESMPGWARKLNVINPVAYFIEVIRMVLLKGSRFRDISEQFAFIGSYAVIINLLAVWNYRKRS